MSSLQWGITEITNHHSSFTTHHSNIETASANAKSDFLEFMQMSLAEKMRSMILNEMHLTEEQIKALPPEERRKIEEEILERIKEKLKA